MLVPTLEMEARMADLRERLRAHAPEAAPATEQGETRPNPSVEPQQQHAASTHNAARKQVDMVSFFYGAEGERALPYAYLLDIDRKEPGRIEVQFSTCTIIIEGLRLNPVMVSLKNHTLSELRVSNGAANATDEEPWIQKIAVRNRD
jgi:hypothetical protein